jgi:iron complex outermembrane recepter protein
MCKQSQRSILIAIIVAISPMLTLTIFMVQPVRAEKEKSERSLQFPTEAPQVGDLERSRISMTDRLAQDPSIAVVQVTGVRIDQTSNGIEVILDTKDGITIQAQTRSEGNTLIAEIPNAILALGDRQDFRADKPATGITAIAIVPLEGNRIQISITGEAKAPIAEIKTGKGLVLAVTSPSAASTAEEEDEIEITVTAEQQRGYRVPNATTATKTDTPLRDIPQSIQIVPRQVIKDQGATRVSEITRNVSGVNVTTGPSGVGEFYTIRGFSGNEFGASNEFRNGFRSLGLGTFNTNNIEKVEVLKGPASVLYGQIEPGGIINFVTKKPLDRPYYSAELELGSFNFYRPSLDISGPLTDDKRLLYRLNVGYEKSGSFVDFVNRQIFQISPSLTYNISDNTKLTFSYEYVSETGTNNPGLPRNPIAFELPRNLFLGEPDDTVDSKSQSLTLGLDHRFDENWQLRSQFAWQTESFKRNAYRIGNSLNEDGRTLNRFLQNDIEDRADSYSIQTDLIGKFKTGSIDHQVLLGIDWTKFNDLDATGFSNVDPIDVFAPIYNSVPRPTLFDSDASRFTTEANSIGFYLQDQITLLPNLKLLVGGRYDIINEKSGFQQLDQNGVTPIGDLEEDSFSNQAFSPRIGIVYQPIEAISLYASYSSSFVPNNTQTRTGELIEPTKGTQFEVGVKTEVFDGKLAASLSAYQITKTNVLTIDPADSDFSIPIGEVRSRGIELDIAGEPQPGWNIIASLFLNESIVTVGDENSPVGNILIDAPRTGAGLWSTYEIQTGDLKGLGFGAGIFYVGDIQATLPNSFVLPSYIRTDATIFYKRDNWRISLNFKNLFDKNYYSNQGAIYAGDPFTVLGSFSVSF